MTDFEAKMQTSGRAQRYIDGQLAFIRKVVDFNDWKVAADITADGVHRYAQSLTEQGRAAHIPRPSSR